MSIVQKQPRPREWWENSSGNRIFIVGKTEDGRIVYQNPNHCMIDVGLPWEDYKYLPECNSWEWKKPDFVHLHPERFGWHILRKDVDFVERIDSPGKMDKVNSFAGKSIAEFSRKVYCLREDIPELPVPAFTMTYAERNCILLAMSGIHAELKTIQNILKS